MHRRENSHKHYEQKTIYMLYYLCNKTLCLIFKYFIYSQLRLSLDLNIYFNDYYYFFFNHGN